MLDYIQGLSMFYLTSIIFFEQKYLILETSSSTNLEQLWPPQNTQNKARS